MSLDIGSLSGRHNMFLEWAHTAFASRPDRSADLHRASTISRLCYSADESSCRALPEKSPMMLLD